MTKGIYLLITVMLCSCGSGRKTEDGVNTLHLSMDHVQDDVSLSEIASSVSCISLATSNSTLIDEVIRVISQNGFVYVADKGSVYKYDKSGRLVDKLHQQGLAPNEYNSVSDFQVDSQGNVWIVSRNEKGLYKYNWANELQTKITLDCWVSNIYLADDETMLLYVGNEVDGSGNKQLHEFDLLTKKRAKASLDIDSQKNKYLHIRSNNYFSGVSDQACSFFFQPFNDTIYRVSPPDLDIIPAFYVDMASKNIPASFYDKEYHDVMDFFQNLSKNAYAYGTDLFLEQPASYLFSFYQAGQCYMALLPKEKDSVGLVFKGIIEDTHLCGFPIELNGLKLFAQRDGSLVLVLSASDILDFSQEKLNEPERDKLRKVFKSGEEDQNEMLLHIELK